MTAEERVASLHTRMDALRRARERRKAGVTGAAVLTLTGCLILLIGSAGTGGPVRTAGLYSGATLLFADAGAYVLVAVIAFMTGVIVTAVLMRRRAKREKDPEKQNPKETDGEDGEVTT